MTDEDRIKFDRQPGSTSHQSDDEDDDDDGDGHTQRRPIKTEEDGTE